MNLIGNSFPLNVSKENLIKSSGDKSPLVNLDNTEEKEYAVVLKKDINYDEFWNEIESISDTDRFVPSRRVDIVNNRDGSYRICHYALTDAEANFLKNDPRVYSVEISPDKRKDIEIGLRAIQRGNFNKPSNNGGIELNWGLIRCINRNNVYGQTSSTSENYKYLLDGTGVDVVIQDSGIEHNHPEFKDYNGNSRVQLINWYTESGITGTQSANHYRDYDGHGTHVASIATGLTFGWAKNARVYSQKLAGLEGSGDSGTGISIANAFDTIRLWHRNKPIDPNTGFKRPTVVNMSWGYRTPANSSWTLANIDSYLTDMNYRGTNYDIVATATSLGATTWQVRWLLGAMPFFSAGYFRFPLRVSTVDAEIQEMIDEGIHICIAAGNDYNKIDVDGGTDYNNEYYWAGDGSTAQGWYNYHRGSSPYDDQAINVGNMDSTTHNASFERKADSSCTGPGVDVYAPGTSIKAACSNTTIQSSNVYYNNSGFKQAILSGTSQASPQIAGIAAILLQMSPGASVSAVKNWIINKCTSNVMYDTGLDNDWSNSGYTNNVSDTAYTTSLKGGNNILGFNPLGQEKDQITTGSVTFNNISVTLT